MKKNLFSKFYSRIKYRTNRKYKDRLFCLIFGDERYKNNALLLYNAINGTEYTNVNDLEIYTISYIVFYNGQENLPEKTILKLSDAFMEPVEPGTFEWIATVYNINNPYNEALKVKCKPLNDYTILIEKIRLYSYNYPIEAAIDIANFSKR